MFLLPAEEHPPAPPHTRTPQNPSPYDTIRTDLDDYAWPTDAGRIVTSTFGEFRRTHFHAGIDVSTGDRTGFRVFAARNGYVSRIRIEPDGYGKMLFVRHPDGYTTTYAHLRGFADRLERKARDEQLRLQRYPVDIPCPPEEFPVRKGELIAFTGETGSGSEHLHFEIRDENMNGVNPALAPLLRHPDHLPPRFLRMAAIPVGDGSRVNDAPEPTILPLRATGPHSWLLPRPIRIAGSAGLAIDVRDRSDGSRFQNGAYRHRLFIDGDLLFEIRLDRAPIAESQQITIAYASDLLESGSGRFEKLYVDGLHNLPFYSNPEVGAGLLTIGRLASGTHRLSVLSQDFAGNTAELTGTFTIDSSREATPKAVDTTASVTLLPGRTVDFLSDNGAFRLTGDSLAVYDTTTLRVRKSWDTEGAYYALTPRGGVLRHGLTVTIRPPGTDPHQGIFQRVRSDWSLIRRAVRNADGSISALMGRWIGDVRILRDDSPPEISSPRFYPSGRGGPVARVRVFDEGAGVDYQSLVTYIDSTFVVPEIDGEHRRVTVSPPKWLTRGSHHFLIRLSDHLGNTRSLERRFLVP